MLEELVKSNSALVTTNDELLPSVNNLIKANDKLSHWVGNRRNNRTYEDSPVPLPKTLCPHFNI